MRVFSTVRSWSNENKSCMRVDKQAFVLDFSELSCPGYTISQVIYPYTSLEIRNFYSN